MKKNRRKNKISKRELFLLSLLLITAAAAVCWNFYGSKLYSEIRILKAELCALETEIDRFSSLLDEQPVIEDQWLELEGLKEELILALPSEEELPQVLERLELTTALYRQLINSLKIGELYPGDKLSTIDISLSAAGPANRLERLLFELENFPHSLVIKSISWVNQDTEQSNIEIDLRLLFYPDSGIDQSGIEIEVP